MPGVQSTPTPDDALPVARHFAQRVEARAHVRAAFRIVRVRTNEARRPVASSLDTLLVEPLNGAGERLVRRATDLVAREQRHVSVERRVLDALRRGGSAQLLEPAHEFSAFRVLSGLATDDRRDVVDDLRLGMLARVARRSI